MVRCEIIANQSVQEEIITLLEEYIPDILYTIIPVVTGKGKNSYKNGDNVWPETNFLLITYIEEEKINEIKSIVSAVKRQYQQEGIKLFFVKAENI